MKKIKESHLRWSRHVQKRATNASIRNCELIQLEEMKTSIGRQKITLVVVKQDMSIKKQQIICISKIKEATNNMTLERIEWRKRMQVADLD